MSVVAHSMGGLVTRWVANTTDAAGAPRATKLGKVITSGTPYEGSVLSAVANGATDASGMSDTRVLLLNYLCGQHGPKPARGAVASCRYEASMIEAIPSRFASLADL